MGWIMCLFGRHKRFDVVLTPEGVRGIRCSTCGKIMPSNYFEGKKAPPQNENASKGDETEHTAEES